MAWLKSCSCIILRQHYHFDLFVDHSFFRKGGLACFLIAFTRRVQRCTRVTGTKKKQAKKKKEFQTASASRETEVQSGSIGHQVASLLTAGVSAVLCFLYYPCFLITDSLVFFLLSENNNNQCRPRIHGTQEIGIISRITKNLDSQRTSVLRLRRTAESCRESDPPWVLQKPRHLPTSLAPKRLSLSSQRNTRS
jgi:hypothetical protein